MSQRIVANTTPKTKSPSSPFGKEDIGGFGSQHGFGSRDRAFGVWFTKEGCPCACAVMQARPAQLCRLEQLFVFMTQKASSDITWIDGQNPADAFQTKNAITARSKEPLFSLAKASLAMAVFRATVAQIAIDR